MLSDFSNHLLSIICSYLRIYDIECLIKTYNNKELIEINKKRIENFIKNKMIYQKMNIPSIIKYHINKNNLYEKKIDYELYSNIIQAKDVNLQKRRGYTDYIDFIQKDDFDNTNIIYGTDCYKRFYIAVLFDKISDSTITKNNIAVFFQRYYDDEFYFVSCMDSFVAYHTCQTQNVNCTILNNYYQSLFKLIKNKNHILINSEYDLDSGKDIDKIYYLKLSEI
jgi:hypothetical protein